MKRRETNGNGRALQVLEGGETRKGGHLRKILLAIGILLLCVPLSANDVRNLAMGRLTLLAESELNRLDMYCFGQNPAGLLRSAPVSFSDNEFEFEQSSEGDVLSDYTYLETYATGYGHVGASKSFDQWAAGQPIPNELLEFMPIPWSGLGYSFRPYPSRPLGVCWRSRSADAATAISGSWSHGEDGAPVRRLTVNTPQIDVVRSGTFGSIDYGIEAAAFDLMAAGPHTRANFIGPGVRAGISAPTEAFTWGLSARYYHPFFDAEIPFWSDKLNGNAAEGNGALLLLPAEALKLALRGGYKWVKVENLSFISPWGGIRTAYDPPEGPVVAGVEATWGDVHTSYSDFGYDEKQDSLGLGGGIGVRAEGYFGGVEAHYSTIGSRPFDAQSAGTLVLQAGGEAVVGTAVVRAGYARSSTRWASGSSSPPTHWFTGGFTMNLEAMKLDVAYNLTRRSATDWEHLLCFALRSNLSGGYTGD